MSCFFVFFFCFAHALVCCLEWCGGVGVEFYRFQFCPNCGKKMTRPHSKSVGNLQIAASEDSSEIENRMAGKLKIQAGKLKLHSSRWVVLNGKFLYIFKNKEKEFPDTVFFIQGYFIQFVKNEHHNLHLIKLIPPSGANSRTASFYTSHEDEAKKWTEKLELAAQTVSIEKFYDMGNSLGKGSFAEVRIAKEKESGREVAVKIIQKKVIDGKQKEYIRIEMSVMKLVNHPNVMKLEQVFETKTKVFMVMPLYNGGDLYEYMKQNARKGLNEDQVRQIIWQVINALRYLHSVGIVHRDLKPENVCVFVFVFVLFLFLFGVCCTLRVGCAGVILFLVTIEKRNGTDRCCDNRLWFVEICGTA